MMIFSTCLISAALYFFIFLDPCTSSTTSGLYVGAFATPSIPITRYTDRVLQFQLRKRSQSERCTLFRHCNQSKRFASSTNHHESEHTNESKLSAHTYTHHIALKTRNIENAINFYSLLGFQVETKFISGPSRCAWLIHSSHQNNEPDTITSRIELLEVPSHMLNESEGIIQRAVDLTKREELLGLNHFALDVTKDIPRSIDGSEDGTSCELYQLREWMDDLNQESIARFGRSLRVALEPTKRMIGKEIYEMAFLYDADGVLVELLNHSGTLKQEIDDGWEPWDGPWIAQD